MAISRSRSGAWLTGMGRVRPCPLRRTSGYVWIWRIALKKSSLLGSEVLIQFSWAQEDAAMMGERTVMQEALFYEFNLERHVPADHLLRRSTGSST